MYIIAFTTAVDRSLDGLPPALEPSKEKAKEIGTKASLINSLIIYTARR